MSRPPHTVRVPTCFVANALPLCAYSFLTEGPLGMMGAVHCTLNGRKYTTMYCSRFDLYLEEAVGAIAARACASWLSWFHSWSFAVITPSPSMAENLRPQIPHVTGILNGCDTKSFSPEGPACTDMQDLARPIWLYVGRICKEKNVGVLMDLALQAKLEGTVAVVGKGPDLDEFQTAHAGAKSSTPVKFLGWRSGAELESVYRSADVFVFPSLTDTFGQVMVEAMASGLPVAAFPTTGPVDVVLDGVTGSLDSCMLQACQKALSTKNADACVAHARSFSWDEMSKKFLKVQPPVQEAVSRSSRTVTRMLLQALAVLCVAVVLSVVWRCLM